MNRIHHVIAVGLVATVGLAATSGAASAPATGSGLAPSSAQASSKLGLRPLRRPPLPRPPDIAGPAFARFGVGCTFSHRNQDDPIVFPRQAGRSHDHTFFGNRSTDAFSTTASLREERQSTCRTRADSSAYWAPTLFVGGRAIEPRTLIALYTRRTSDSVEPFPAGLKVIAGDANARTAQSLHITYWSCAVERARARRSSTVPTCPGTRRGGLRLHVNFPDCWDDRRLDSANHKSHMAYSSRGACPGSHPVEMPALSLVIYYHVSGGPSAELSSGDQFSAHADFVNAWKQAMLTRLVDRYLGG